ncbi:uncharacterized protein SETTUDRAFT_110023 [Exserohilum turcica Et28A]|uniref:Enoyl reductase (ER) domain-containing protein n=1 Tax=Exserohilum turcicum (strain 28A) TaxID=671987 RepID=R0KE38_EXST2|nr:uncharacterized protein SETTUDRAFT_110023 [Exserohilum turcica Et28A]EOA86427.1 hypothetical protein SETTUDRAFT_110023 [Exserohilum turcica Et28A]
MNALVGDEAGGYRLAHNIEIPCPKPGTMLCRVHAVAVSPYDAKISDYSNIPGAIGGCDFAGIVVEVGDDVKRFKAGDRILAVTFGLNALDKSAGAFAEYALATEDLACHVPDDMSLSQASSVGLAVATAGLALFQAPGLQLSMPRRETPEQESPPFVLVSGGATDTGTMAIQLLKIAGYTPIVTCSPRNNTLCTSYGAAACFDYHSASCGADIRSHTSNSLLYVFDCVTDTETMRMCYSALGSSGGKYIAIEALDCAIKYTRRDVVADWLMAPTIMGSPVLISGTYGRPSTPAHRRFGAAFFALVETLLREGKLKGHPVQMRDGGLAKIPTYVDNVRVRGVQAQRQVVPLVVE